VKAVRVGDPSVIEILILVFKRQVLVKPQRTKKGKILDLIGRVEAGGNSWQREQEDQNEKKAYSHSTRQPIVQKP
jgi:hypothetical protein